MYVHHVLVEKACVEHKDDERREEREVNPDNPTDTVPLEDVVKLGVVTFWSIPGDHIANNCDRGVQEHENSIPTYDFVENSGIHVQEILAEESNAKENKKDKAVE